MEPDAAMRARLRRTGLEPIAAPAEDLPLGDGSVDAVACGDAWHWFDADRAAAEVHRVLRPGGALALVWRWPEDADTGWARVVGARLAGLRGEHPGFTGEQGREGLTRHGGFWPLEHVVVRYVHETDHAGALAAVASISYVARLPEPERAALLEELAAVIPPGTHRTPTRADVWRTTRA